MSSEIDQNDKEHQSINTVEFTRTDGETEIRKLSSPLDLRFIRKGDLVRIEDPYMLGETYEEIISCWKEIRTIGADIIFCKVIDTRTLSQFDVLGKVIEDNTISIIAKLCSYSYIRMINK